jgi:hypothetical protein
LINVVVVAAVAVAAIHSIVSIVVVDIVLIALAKKNSTHLRRSIPPTHPFLSYPPPKILTSSWLLRHSCLGRRRRRRPVHCDGHSRRGWRRPLTLAKKLVIVVVFVILDRQSDELGETDVTCDVWMERTLSATTNQGRKTKYDDIKVHDVIRLKIPWFPEVVGAVGGVYGTNILIPTLKPFSSPKKRERSSFLTSTIATMAQTGTWCRSKMTP